MKDRIVEHPHRYQLVPVPGQPDVYDFVPVPGTVIEEGTALNKANLLTDQTAQQLSMTQADPKVDDALQKIGTASYMGFLESVSSDTLDAAFGKHNEEDMPSIGRQLAMYDRFKTEGASNLQALRSAGSLAHIEQTPAAYNEVRDSQEICELIEKSPYALERLGGVVPLCPQEGGETDLTYCFFASDKYTEVGNTSKGQDTLLETYKVEITGNYRFCTFMIFVANSSNMYLNIQMWVDGKMVSQKRPVNSNTNVHASFEVHVKKRQKVEFRAYWPESDSGSNNGRFYYLGLRAYTARVPDIQSLSPGENLYMNMLPGRAAGISGLTKTPKELYRCQSPLSGKIRLKAVTNIFPGTTYYPQGVIILHNGTEIYRWQQTEEQTRNWTYQKHQKDVELKKGDMLIVQAYTTSTSNGTSIYLVDLQFCIAQKDKFPD